MPYDTIDSLRPESEGHAGSDEQETVILLRNIERNTKKIGRWQKAACIMLIVILLVMVFSPIIGPPMFFFFVDTFFG